jgi:hypothetical protein
VNTTPLRILITGSRYWRDRDAIRDALTQHTHNHDPRAVTVVHGAARGADTLAGEEAARLGFSVEVHPAKWAKHGRQAGPIRNTEMVNKGADVCLAFIHPYSRGTLHCMSLARDAGIDVYQYQQRPPTIAYTP